MPNWSGDSISFSTSLTAVHLPFCWRFVFRLFSFHLGLFFACLGLKFNLSRDDCIFLLAPVCNFPVGGTASFNNLLQVLQLSLHQKYKKYLSGGRVVIFSFGQEGSCQKYCMMWVVGGGGGGILNYFGPLKHILCPPPCNINNECSPISFLWNLVKIKWLQLIF